MEKKRNVNILEFGNYFEIMEVKEILQQTYLKIVYKTN